MNKVADTNIGLEKKKADELVRWYHNVSTHIAYPLAVPFEDATPDALVVAIFMMGARSPVIRLKLLARASPVPRCGAGKTCKTVSNECE